LARNCLDGERPARQLLTHSVGLRPAMPHCERFIQSLHRQ
jgi:hypothetical protein